MGEYFKKIVINLKENSKENNGDTLRQLEAV
jgi:hypothetical protein